MARHAQYWAMAPTLVVAAVGALLAAALLGPAFDRRSLAVVVAAAVVPSLDAVLALALDGATNAALHTLVVPGLAALALYVDTELRGERSEETDDGRATERTDSTDDAPRRPLRDWSPRLQRPTLQGPSIVRERFGWRGVRTAWVAIAAYVVGGIGLALFAGEGANLLYPLYDRYYVVGGRLAYSSQEGVVQTYVAIAGDASNGLLSLGSPGTTETHFVGSWLQPTPEAGLERGVEREVAIVESGWQAVLVLGAAVVIAIRGWEAAIRDRTRSARDRQSPNGDAEVR